MVSGKLVCNVCLVTSLLSTTATHSCLASAAYPLQFSPGPMQQAIHHKLVQIGHKVPHLLGQPVCCCQCPASFTRACFDAHTIQRRPSPSYLHGQRRRNISRTNTLITPFWHQSCSWMSQIGHIMGALALISSCSACIAVCALPRDIHRPTMLLV